MGFFSKKDKAAEAADESARNALFGGRSGGTSPAPSANPYASPPPPYGAAPPAQNNAPRSGGSGGYGGYGGPQANDPNRDALFSGRQTGGGGYGQPPSSGYGQPPPSGYGSSGGYGSGSGGYGADQDRKLTAEEEEEADIEDIKRRIQFTKQESVSSTRNALRVAAQAEETGRNTLSRLGQQGERLYNTEKNLDVAAAHNRAAADKASELKTLNRSMFAVNIKNPMSKNREKEEAKILHTSGREGGKGENEADGV